MHHLPKKCRPPPFPSPQITRKPSRMISVSAPMFIPFVFPSERKVCSLRAHFWLHPNCETPNFFKSWKRNVADRGGHDGDVDRWSKPSEGDPRGYNYNIFRWMYSGMLVILGAIRMAFRRLQLEMSIFNLKASMGYANLSSFLFKFCRYSIALANII